MQIRVDPKSDVPVFRQIMDAVKSAIARGACAPGDMLPSVRQMALLAVVNPNTVAKAYRELEREEIVVTRPGAGIFVANGSARACRTAWRETVSARFHEVVAEARRAGLSDDELRAAFEESVRNRIAGREGSGRGAS